MILQFRKISLNPPSPLTLLPSSCVTRTHFVSLASPEYWHTSTVQRRSSLAPVLCSIVSVYSKKRNSRPLLQLTLPGSVCWPWPTDLRLDHARKTWYHNITSWPARAKNIQVSSEMDFLRILQLWAHWPEYWESNKKTIGSIDHNGQNSIVIPTLTSQCCLHVSCM